MNKNLFPTLAAGLILCSGMASAYTLTKFKSSPAVRLNTPVLPDSLQKENAFSAEQLLGARTPLTLRDEMADWTTVVNVFRCPDRRQVSHPRSLCREQTPV